MKPAPIRPLVLLALLCASCTKADDSDPLVKNAQTAIAQAKEHFAEIDKAESDNADALRNADARSAAAVHIYATVIRSDSPKWIKTATTALAAYQANKTDATAANLKAATALLSTATAESKKYEAAITAGTLKP